MSLMIMIALCFSGLFCMFFFLLRGQENMLKKLQNELIQNRVQLHKIETRLATLLGEDIDPLPSSASMSVSPTHTSTTDPQSLQSLSFTNDRSNQATTKNGLDLQLPTR